MRSDEDLRGSTGSAPATNSQYEKVWKQFSAYADEMGCSAWRAHPLLITLWFDSRRHLATGTHQQAIAAIRKKHEVAGVPLPETDLVYLWIADHARHEGGRRPQKKNTPRHVTAAEVSTLATHCWQTAVAQDQDLTGWDRDASRNPSGDTKCRRALRDRAWSLLLYALGWRHDHTTHVNRRRTILRSYGVEVTADGSKADQERKGTTRKVQHLGDSGQGSNRCAKRSVCPACALIDMIEYDKGVLWEIGEPAGFGPLFPSPQDPLRPWSGSSARAALRIVAAVAGLHEVDRLGTHSFKKGHVTHRNVVGKESLEEMDDLETSPSVLYSNYLVFDRIPGKGHLGR